MRMESKVRCECHESTFSNVLLVYLIQKLAFCRRGIQPLPVRDEAYQYSDTAIVRCYYLNTTMQVDYAWQHTDFHSVSWKGDDCDYLGTRASAGVDIELGHHNPRRHEHAENHTSGERAGASSLYWWHALIKVALILMTQSWKSASIPGIYGTLPKTWLAQYSKWTHVLWTHEDNAQLVKTLYPEYFNLYQAFLAEIYRADIARSLYMHTLSVENH